MNRLFAEVYLDEDVHVLIAELVRSYGFAATTARQEHKLGLVDEVQLAYAVQTEKVILTHNRIDFERLAESYFHAGKDHFGIIIAVRRSPYEVARRVARILDHVSAEEMKNQLKYI